MTEELHFGMGVAIAGDWIIQTPLFTGIAGIQAYPPSEDLSIGVAATCGPGGDVSTNGATEVFKALATELAPDSPLPPQI